MIIVLKNSFFILALIGGLGELAAKISDLRLCADAECKEMIGVGKTVVRYHAPEAYMLSFTNNQEVKIFSKEAGSNPDLWGVMIDGRRGYVHKKHIQEQKVYKKDLTFEVPTIDISKTTKKENEKDIGQEKPGSTSLSQETGKPSDNTEISQNKQSEITQTQPQLGDHARHVTLSPEDMEYNRVKSSYSNTNGDYVLEANLPLPSKIEDHVVEDHNLVTSTNEKHVVETSLPVAPTKENLPIVPTNENHVVEASLPVVSNNKDHAVEPNLPVMSTNENHVVEDNSPVASTNENHVVEATLPVSTINKNYVGEANLPVVPTNENHVEDNNPVASTNENHMVDGNLSVGPTNENDVMETSLPVASRNIDHVVEANKPVASTNEDHVVESNLPVTSTSTMGDPVVEVTNGDHVVMETSHPVSSTSGEFVVEAIVPVEATPTLISVSSNPTIAVNKNLEVIDGTSINVERESAGVVEEKATVAIQPSMTNVPKQATEVPEIQSSVVNQEETVDLFEPILEAKIEQPVDLKQATPTKVESIGVPEVEITKPIPDDVPSTLENREAVPSNTVLYTPPVYASDLDVKPSEVIVENLQERVAITKENKHVTHDEYKDVEADEDDSSQDIGAQADDDEEINELSSSNDDDEEEEDEEEEEEEEEEELEENDEDRKVDFQAHIDNLKKAYLDQEEEKYPTDKNPLEEKKEDQMKLADEEISGEILENIESEVDKEEISLNTNTMASEIDQPQHLSSQDELIENSIIHNIDSFPANIEDTIKGTAAQSVLSSSDEVVTPLNVQAEHKTEGAQGMPSKLLQDSENVVEIDRLSLNTNTIPAEMPQAINSTTEEISIDTSIYENQDVLKSKSSLFPNKDSSQDVASQSSSAISDEVVAKPDIQMDHKTEEIQEIPEKISESSENEEDNAKLSLNEGTTEAAMPLAVNLTTQETSRENPISETPEVLKSYQEDNTGESVLTSSDELVTPPNIQVEYKPEQIQQEIPSFEENVVSSKNENIDQDLIKELNIDNTKENINLREVKELENNVDTYDSGSDIKFHMPGDIKFHMPGDMEYNLPPLSNSGQNITFHSPNDFADISDGHLPPQNSLPNTHFHSPNEFVDIGDGQPDNIVLQHREEDKLVSSEHIINEQIQPEIPKQNRDQSIHNHQPNLVLQENQYQQVDGIGKSSTLEGYQANKEDHLIVNPEGRDVQVTFHDESDIIVKQSQVNVTNIVEEANTGNQNLPDALAMTVLPDEDISGNTVPPITAGVEQEYESVGWLMQFVPSWLHFISHGPKQPSSIGSVSGDQLCLLAIVAVTLLSLYVINQCLEKASREKPLIAKVAELDKKLFNVRNELLITKNELPEKELVAYDPAFIEHVGEMQQKLDESDKVVKKQKLEISQIACEKENVVKECSKINEYNSQLLTQLNEAQIQQQAALEKARQAEEMVEEMIQLNKEKNENEDNEKFLSVVKNLQEQLEGQKTMLARYEPKYRKKEKEAKDLSKESKQLKVDLANERLKVDKLKNELTHAAKINTEKEVEWQKLSDLRQSELTEKIEVADKMEKEVLRLKNLISDKENEVEAKEEQLEELQEIVTELGMKQNKHQNNDWEEGEGWDMVDDKSMDEIKEIAQLKVQVRRATDAKNILETESEEITKRVSDLEQQLKTITDECQFMRNSRDEAFKKSETTERQLDVLKEYFNKKETDLQRQLGLQTAKFGNVSTDAESSAKKLLSVMSELESTNDALKAVKREMEEQEKSLKAEIASHEKKAHENWIAAKQVDRKLTDVQGEMSILRNKLTTVEEKNASLELQNTDLQSTIKIIQQTKSEAKNGHGLSASSESLNNSDIKPSPTSFTSNDSSLPPLPGLDMNSSLSGLTSLPVSMGLPPNMMMQPMIPRPLMDTRLPPLGQMSSAPRERYSHQTSSPDYDRYRPHSNSSSHYGEFSPRSDRRSQRRPSPTRSEHGSSSYRRSYRGPSPSRSERGYSPDRRRQPLSPSQSDRGGSPYSQR